MNPDDPNQQDQTSFDLVDGGQKLGTIANGQFTPFGQAAPNPAAPATFSEAPGGMTRQPSFDPNQATGSQGAAGANGFPTAMAFSDHPTDSFSARVGNGQYTSPQLAEANGYTRFPTEKVGLSYEDYLGSSDQVRQALDEAFGLQANNPRYYSAGDAQGAAFLTHPLETWELNMARLSPNNSPRDFISGTNRGYDLWNVDPASRGDLFYEQPGGPGRDGLLPFNRTFGRRF